MELLTNLLHKIRMPISAEAEIVLLLDRVSEPQRGRIKKEPLLAMEDGNLVMVVDHVFDDIPSWAQWNPDTQLLSITQMGGKIDEVKTVIKREYLETLLSARKLLLVSNNDKDGKIMHYVPFLA